MTFKIESNGFNVTFSSNNKQVVVTDARTSHYKEERRLPGSTLLTIIDNILRMAKTSFILKGNTQEWAYTPNGSYNLKAYCDTDIITFTLDEDDDGSYEVELKVVEGSFEDFIKIINL